MLFLIFPLLGELIERGDQGVIVLCLKEHQVLIGLAFGFLHGVIHAVLPGHPLKILDVLV